MRVVCVSDTHGYHRRTDVPDGDVLVHAGDVTLDGSLEGVEFFNDWLGRCPTGTRW
jgi:predicted phosphodiesterase